LTISNGNNHLFGTFCGYKSGHTVDVSGDNAVISFRSDSYYEEGGFLLFFSVQPPVPPNVTLPGEVLRLLPGYKMEFPAKGTPPIYTALIRNSTVLVNTTDTASIIFYEEGNYTCVATSDYGIYEGKFSVIFNGLLRMVSI